ncbi:hypothetical protein DBR44_16285 [Aquitalea sp. FJL05]|uniref:hypothetical protein n=1 Tax=Aquitalea sp. FJL05 TaxID=2153366 RepID=UPI000F5964F5|nr:hypothetical protein [Aquitalea sp. FJL05]RQO68231.1 hypothetical protein DBR44_16285 [Aquitalea sp. FJL05]
MFVISQATSARLPVTVQQYDTAGRLQQHQFPVEIKRLTQQQWDALFAHHQVTGESGQTVSENLQANAALLAEAITGWDEVNDMQGQSVPYSATTLRELLLGPDGPALSRGMFDAIFSLRYGTAAQKN